jgi:outer membrane protein TolC
MKRCRELVCASLLPAVAFPLIAQAPETYRDMATKAIRAGKLSPPEHLKDYVKDGKLTLSLHDAIVLALENNSSIRIQQAAVSANQFPLLSAFAPFDPLIQAYMQVNRYSEPGDSELQGVGESSNATLNLLTQTGFLSYTQTLKTGTNVNASLTGSKNSNNSGFYFFNPSYTSTFNFTFTQPLLRNAGRFAQTAQIVIARQSLQQSRSSFEAQVNETIYQVVTEYWTVVQARGVLDVQQKSVALAQASYQHDKRALELGALSPLDIYRSQSEVASRHLAVVQSQYTLKQAQEDLRLAIGAEQDPAIAALDLDLSESPEPADNLEIPDMAEVLGKALAERPEIEAAQKALANDETRIRYAHDQMRPDLSLQGFYQSSGLGGNQYNLNNGQLISTGGLGSSFSQLGTFGYPGYGGQLTLDLTLRNRAAQAALGTALVSRRRDLYAQRQTKEQITHDVTDAVHTLEEAKITLAASKDAFELAQKSLSADQRKYELGAETNFFVLDAQGKLAQANLDLLQTQISYQVARAAVEHATGELLEPYQVQIKELSR